MSGDLLDAKAYTLNGILDPISTSKPSRNERRESRSSLDARKESVCHYETHFSDGRFQMSSAPCPLPTYHSELDRNLVNHFQKPQVRCADFTIDASIEVMFARHTLQSKKFQRMLPGIDHELKMEMNPPLEYPEVFAALQNET